MGQVLIENSEGVLRHYRRLVSEGKVSFNAEQLKIVNSLQELDEKLDLYKEQMGQSGWKARLKLGKFKQPAPKGLYIWGGVGCGKTIGMDLFFKSSNDILFLKAEFSPCFA